MTPAFQRSGFQKTGFQIGDEDDLRGRVRRRGRIKIWTDEELGLTKPKVEKKVDLAPLLARAKSLLERLKKVEKRLHELEVGKNLRAFEKTIEIARQKRLEEERQEEEEIALILALDDLWT